MRPDRADAESTLGRTRWLRAILAVAARPRLWPTALRQCAAFAPRGWWRRPPLLPLLDRAYVRFRLETAYGAAVAPRANDLVAYLEWCRDRRRALRRARREGTGTLRRPVDATRESTGHRR